MTDAPEAAPSAPGLLVRLYALVSRPGWIRRLLLAGAVVVFLVCLVILWSGADYRQDPSALVPRTADLFVETRDLDKLLKNVGYWNLWNAEHKVQDGEPRNLFQIEVVQYFTTLIPDLGTYIPFLWLSDAKKSALAIAEGDSAGEKAWAIYLETADVGRVLSEMRLEPKIRIEGPAQAREGIFELVGENGGSLFMAVLTPWIVISPDRQLPEFAFAIMKKPSLSLANAKLLPSWQRRTSVRGMAHPLYLAARPDTGNLLGGLGTWVDDKARFVFSAAVEADNKVEATVSIATISGSVRGGGAWPIVKLLLFLIALGCLALVLFSLLVMLGWGAKLKLAAMRAGIMPRTHPEAVTPSTAFLEDSGDSTHKNDISLQENLQEERADTNPHNVAPAGNPADADEASMAKEEIPETETYTDSARNHTVPNPGASNDDDLPDTNNNNKTDGYL